MLAALTASASANPVVLEFADELERFEETQRARGPNLIYYSDEQGGAALRRLMNASRARAVVGAFYADKRRLHEPYPLLQKLQPLIQRYDAADRGDFRQNEAEFLDRVEWTVQVAIGSMDIWDWREGPGRPLNRNLIAGLSEQRPVLLAATARLQQMLKIYALNSSPSASERLLALHAEVGAARARLAAIPSE